MIDNDHDGASRYARVFAYHEIHDVNVKDVYCITPEIFLQHLWTMRDASAGSLRSLIITFDDGHESNIRLAAPLLENMELCGHFFLPTTWIGRRKNFMNWNDVRTLARRGHRIGSHTATHTFLPSCDANRMHAELAGSRMTLEDRLGYEVSSISMPGGRWNEDVLRACAAAGYKTVYTSEPGYFRSGAVDGPLQMPTVIGRFAVQRRTSLTAIKGYSYGSWLTTKRLKTLYQVRASVRRILGDQTYQRLWSHLFRAVPGQETV